MLARILRWRSSPSTPQDDFRRHHARLCTPPLPPFSHTSGSADGSTDGTAYAHVVDPYHLVVCQHGVLSTSADFDNVIADLFIHHEVSVLEAVEKAEAAMSPRSGPFSSSTNSSAHRTSSPSVTRTTPTPCSHNDTASLNAASTQSPRSNATATPLRPDTALTLEQRTRRDAYQRSFHLAVEHPNKSSGRLYRSGNLRVFSPGSNNYLHSDAGTLACARKMLAETVPQLHAWLDDVESRERQRQAQWYVYARTVRTPEAARLATEAAQPLPVCLSFMAHSFGGIIERECLFLLLADSHETRTRDPVLYDAVLHLRRRLLSMKVTFENFLNIATPHCGAGECLWWPIYFGAWCLARLHLCQTYDELILSDAERVLQTRLLDAPHLRVLELFRRRVLFANTHRDLLVGFGTCSLVFENVETDHTRFVGVTAGETHCAAAFADDTIEISKPIVLRSFAEESAAAKAVEATTPQRRVATAAAATRPTHSLLDLEGPWTTAQESESALDAVPQLAARLSAEDDEAVEGESEEKEERMPSGLSCTLRPQPTFTSFSQLTATATPAISAASSPSAAMLQDSAFSAAFTVGRDVSSHAMEEVTLMDVVGNGTWCNDGSADTEDSFFAVAVDPVSGFCGSEKDSGASNGCSDHSTTPSTVCSGSPASLSVSPVPWEARSVSLVRMPPSSPRGIARNGGGGGSDSTSASSSRLSRSSRVTSVLRDPRWAAEHARQAASAVHEEVRRRLSAVSACILGGLRGEDADAVSAFSGVMGSSMAGATMSTTSAAAAEESNVCSPLTASYLIAADDIPQYRKTPRAIAARLRETLSWRVRAVRFDNLIPVGHVACLGNWAFCGRSPLLVQSVAEELLIVLD